MKILHSQLFTVTAISAISRHSYITCRNNMGLTSRFTVSLFAALVLSTLSVLDLNLVQADEPTPSEQLFIFELNRARNNPTRFQTENNLSVDLSYVAAQPPLAVNENLTGSARFKAQEMADNNYFAHESPVSGWPNALARSFGYDLVSSFSDNRNNIESIAGGYDSIIDYTQPLDPLILLIVDAGVPSLGHRNHLLGIGSFWQQFREIGVGYGNNSNSKLRNYWAIHTGYNNNDQPFVTGVVYSDTNGNSRYDLNEGLSGVTISLGSVSTTTNLSGGWSVQTGSGPYTVQCNGGAFVGTSTANITVNSDNVEVDFISGNSSGDVNFGSVADPAPDIKANNSDSPITLGTSEQLDITISIDSGSYSGTSADWYIAVNTPSGWQSFNVSQMDFSIPGISALVQDFGLISFGPAEIFSTPSLSAGTYTYYFVVVLNEQFYYDSVEVDVTP